MKQSAVQSNQLESQHIITYISVHGYIETDLQSSLLAMDMAHYMLSAQRSCHGPVSMLTHSDSLLAELRLRFRFRSSLFSISLGKRYAGFAAYIRCRSPIQSS